MSIHLKPDFTYFVLRFAPKNESVIQGRGGDRGTIGGIQRNEATWIAAYTNKKTDASGTRYIVQLSRGISSYAFAAALRF